MDALDQRQHAKQIGESKQTKINLRLCLATEKHRGKAKEQYKPFW